MFSGVSPPLKRNGYNPHSKLHKFYKNGLISQKLPHGLQLSFLIASSRGPKFILTRRETLHGLLVLSLHFCFVSKLTSSRSSVSWGASVKNDVPGLSFLYVAPPSSLLRPNWLNAWQRLSRSATCYLEHWIRNSSLMTIAIVTKVERPQRLSSCKEHQATVICNFPAEKQIVTGRSYGNFPAIHS